MWPSFGPPASHPAPASSPWWRVECRTQQTIHQRNLSPAPAPVAMRRKAGVAQHPTAPPPRHRARLGYEERLATLAQPRLLPVETRAVWAWAGLIQQPARSTCPEWAAGLASPPPLTADAGPAPQTLAARAQLAARPASRLPHRPAAPGRPARSPFFVALFACSKSVSPAQWPILPRNPRTRYGRRKPVDFNRRHCHVAG